MNLKSILIIIIIILVIAILFNECNDIEFLTAVSATPVCTPACTSGQTCGFPAGATSGAGVCITTATCNPACVNGGTCSGTTCTCPAGWTDPACATPSIGGAVCATACPVGQSCMLATGGVAGSAGVCTPTPVCPVCQNGGTCVAPATSCTCPTGFTGPACDTVSVSGAQCTTSCVSPASSLGTACVSTNTCGSSTSSTTLIVSCICCLLIFSSFGTCIWYVTK